MSKETKIDEPPLLQKHSVSGSTSLSRAQAQCAFVDGKKISHNYFLDGEFICLNDKKQMIDENNIVLNKTDFWLSHGSVQFHEGWFVID